MYICIWGSWLQTWRIELLLHLYINLLHETTKTSSNIQPKATRPTSHLSFMIIVISTWRFTDIVLINTNDYLICYQRTSIKLSRIHVYLVMRDSCMLCKVLFICLMKYFKWASFAVRNTFCCKIFLY